MHQILENTVDELRALAKQIDRSSAESRGFNVAGNNWSFPGISKDDLVQWAVNLADEIESADLDDLGNFEESLYNYGLSIGYLRSNTVQYLWNGNTALAVAAITSTFDGLERVFRATLPEDVPKDTASALANLRKRIRAIDVRIEQLAPKTTDLEGMVDRIIAAAQAADALPEDLESLKEHRAKVAEALERASRDATLAEQAKGNAVEAHSRVEGIEAEAKKVLELCNKAYSAHTSQSLAYAFQKKANTLTFSTWVWAAGLGGALLLQSSRAATNSKMRLPP
jgi:hypothetical protein